MHEVEDGLLTWGDSTQWAINRLSASQAAMAQPQLSAASSSTKRPCKYFNEASCSHENHHGSYSHICAYCYKQGKQFTHPEHKCNAKQRLNTKPQQNSIQGFLKPLDHGLGKATQGHNSNLSDKFVNTDFHVNSKRRSTEIKVASDCSNGHNSVLLSHRNVLPVSTAYNYYGTHEQTVCIICTITSTPFWVKIIICMSHGMTAILTGPRLLVWKHHT